jgi:hypothetical protein
MASIINASTAGAGGVITTADSTGILQLQAGGTTVATIQSTGVNAGIQMGSAYAPTFSYYQSSSQSIGAGTFAKLTFTTSMWDTTGGMYASSRFTPTIAGYYQISGAFTIVNSSTTETALSLYKNGSSYIYLADYIVPSSRMASGTGLVYLNGSTDYVELWAYNSVGGTTSASQNTTWIQGFLARSA